MISEEELLALVKSEREQSIGFDDGDDLSGERELALEYYKGAVPDLPVMMNRSKAVSTDVRDAIETAMPDLVEIFIGGDDTVTFQAVSASDEEQARLETDAVSNVVLEENSGFLLLSTGFKDALMTKIGVFKAWVEEDEEIEFEERRDIPAGWAALAKPFGEQTGAQVEVEDHPTDPEMKVATIRRVKPIKCVKVAAWPSEDFAVGRDTVDLKSGSYCVLRSRPRAYQLLDQGIAREDVDAIQDYAAAGGDAVSKARDTVDEQDDARAAGKSDLRQVEVFEHFIRYDVEETGKSQLWRVLTANEDTLLLEKEKLAELPVASITPYLNPHRFYGTSLADLLIEIQRIKTALMRMMLDSGYFALNQRFEVAEAPGRANEWTISDLLSNIPGAPVRSDDGNSVRPLGSPGLGFDVAGALEYMSSVGENRTGIIRGAQGLNPDSLHETKGGMMQLAAAAQKRVRLIARTFAETGVKDLFLIVRDLMRRNGIEVSGYALGRQEETIQAQAWLPRRAVKAEIGVGSGGREHDLMAGNQLIGMMKEAAEAQGGLDGPLVTQDSMRAAVRRQTERLGYKDAKQFWPDPTPADPNAPPPPDPEAAKMQVQAQADAQKAQIDASAKVQVAQIQAQSAVQLKEMELAQTAELERERMAMDDAFRRDQAEDELRLKGEEMDHEAALKVVAMTSGAAGVSTTVDGPALGGNPG